MDRFWFRRLGGVVLTAAAFTVPARADTPDLVTITVDATGATEPLERVWAFHGFDEANYTNTPEGISLLEALAVMSSAPVHVRSHFLLNTGDGSAALKWGSTNVYTEDASGNAVYDFTVMDEIMDAITGAGAFPLVEIGFMPQALSTRPNPYRNSDTYALDGGCFYPPNDYEKWRELIETWAAHARDRYPGMEASWQWELWNEPDIDYWQGTPAEFARLFDYTEAGLHAVLPNASLGGPSVANASGSFLPEFLQHCATGTNAVTGETGTRLDMVNFHAKGGVAITNGHVQMNLGNQLRIHRTGFNAIHEFIEFRNTPIVISEADPDSCGACPASSTPANAYRLSPAYGAYTVAMMKRTLELAADIGVNLRGVLAWAFLFNDTPYFAGYRVLRTNGIDMPVLNAFKLLGALAGDRVPASSSGALALEEVVENSVRGTGPSGLEAADVDVLATRDERSVSVLVWNYHDDLVEVPATPVTLNVKVPADFGARVTVRHLRVDETHGNAYTVWVGQGSPANPSTAQIGELEQAMQLAVLPPESAPVTDASATLDFARPRHGVSLFTLTAENAGTGGTAGTSGASGSGGALGGGGAGGNSAGAAGQDGAGGVSVAGASGMAATGGAPSSGSGGGSPSGSGGAPRGGSPSSGGSSPTAGGAGPTAGAAKTAGGRAGDSGSASSEGCSCRVGARAPSTTAFGALIVLFLIASARRRRRA
jgi:xylan 1,4-beta-xylosidase